MSARSSFCTVLEGEQRLGQWSGRVLYNQFILNQHYRAALRANRSLIYTRHWPVLELGSDRVCFVCVRERFRVSGCVRVRVSPPPP